MGMHRAYAVPDYEDLYTQPSIDEYLESLRDKGIGRYRCKTIVSGPLLEVEVYPLPKPYKGERAKPEKPSRQAQRNLNDKNTRKYIVRLVNANFGSRDTWATYTYDPEHMPADEKQAQKDMQNYIRRLKRYIKKNGLPELKYLYTTERVENQATGKVHAHHHIILNFPDRDKAESLWTKGRTKARLVQPDTDYTLNGLAHYIAKEETKDKNRKGAKRYGYSLNLDSPKEYIADHKVRKRDVLKLVENQNEGLGFFEDMYASYYGQSYKFMDMTIMGSDYHAGAYIYVRMSQVQQAPGQARRL